MGAMPTSRIEKGRATYEDLIRVPDDKVAEIVAGELFVSPRPAAPHALAIELDLLPLWGETRPPAEPRP